MEISPRKSSKRAQDPVDEWLKTIGYFRKQMPRDTTCLFRAVSEQVYSTQYYHIRVRKECVDYMTENKHIFEEYVTIPFENYLEQMACFTEYGGMTEIHAMSLLYKREVVIFNGQKQTYRTVTDNGFTDKIYLCHTLQKQYESVYASDFVSTAAYCQSIVYQTLYKDVFGMNNVESTVDKMLHDRNGSFRHDKFFLKDNLEIREQLTTEIYNKIENENDETEESQIATRGVPPFPYRIAKALDPNIYRNIDLDIWHEIRREVKNAGWSRHNSHELQIGGKCLVQLDCPEDELDKANNNSIYVSSLEDDPNTNYGKVTEKNVKKDFYGHIQEMSKNQGPVLVFIEELGVKKTVPYSALKPFPLRKGKQSNWAPVCKRNVVLDSNQKLKKPCGMAKRTVKNPMTTVNILSNNTENNTDSEKSNFHANEWRQKPTNHQQFESYAAQNGSNYAVHNSAENFSPRTGHNVRFSRAENIGKEADKEPRDNTDNSLINKDTQFESTISIEGDAEFNSHCKQGGPKEAYYQTYPGEPAAGNQLDNAMRPVNCSVQKSLDANGNDLPFSDPFTLRFFYNLGLEYFRVNNTWNYNANGEPVVLEQWYQGMPAYQEESVDVANLLQDCTAIQQKEDQENVQKALDQSVICEEFANKCSTNEHCQKAENQNCGESVKNSSYQSCEKGKDYAPGNKDFYRTNRNGLVQRFKKNWYNRNQRGQQQAHNANQHGGTNGRTSKFRNTNGNGINVQNSAHQGQMPASPMNSYPPPYVQQNVYPGMPYYPNETEAFGNPYYAPNPGFFPIPCVPPADVPAGNNVPPFPPHLCPGVEYMQAYPGVCPPYMCSQPTPYNIPPQNMQEHWYAVAGQAHFLPYAPGLPVPGEQVCNGVTQSSNQTGSP